MKSLTYLAGEQHEVKGQDLNTGLLKAQDSTESGWEDSSLWVHILALQMSSYVAVRQ